MRMFRAVRFVILAALMLIAVAAAAVAVQEGSWYRFIDRAQMAMDAASLGLGVALESATIAERYLVEGRLRPVFGHERALRVKAHFLVYPARRAKRPPVEAFLAWIHGEAARVQQAAPSHA